MKCNYKITIVYLHPPTPSQHTHLRLLSLAIHSCSSILDFNKFFIALPVKCFSSLELLEHMSHSLALQKHRQHRKFIVMKFSHCRRMHAFNRTTTSESSVRSTDNKQIKSECKYFMQYRKINQIRISNKFHWPKCSHLLIRKVLCFLKPPTSFPTSVLIDISIATSSSGRAQYQKAEAQFEVNGPQNPKFSFIEMFCVNCANVVLRITSM